MLWIFIGITLGAVVFVIQIWMKHLSEARGIEAQIRDLEEEKHSLMQEWKSQQAGTQEANARFEEVRGAIAILNSMINRAVNVNIILGVHTMFFSIYYSQFFIGTLFKEMFAGIFTNPYLAAKTVFQRLCTAGMISVMMC